MSTASSPAPKLGKVDDHENKTTHPQQVTAKLAMQEVTDLLDSEWVMFVSC